MRKRGLEWRPDCGIITKKTLAQTVTQKPGRLSFAGVLLDSSDPMLFHKTTYRKVYDRAKHTRPDCDDVILLNERGEITETCIYNIVLKVGEEYLTPLLNCGLLAGTFRAWLLDRSKIKEKRIKKKDLYNCAQIYVINSVRKWQKAVLVQNNNVNTLF